MWAKLLEHASSVSTFKGTGRRCVGVKVRKSVRLCVEGKKVLLVAAEALPVELIIPILTDES